MAERHQARRARLIAAGLCAICGNVVPPKDKLNCQACSDKRKAADKNQYKKFYRLDNALTDKNMKPQEEFVPDFDIFDAIPMKINLEL